MAFTVHGYITGIAYTLAVADGGALDGTDGVMSLLTEEEGRMHRATPTGPTAALSLQDPESVLVALMELTQITSIDGDPPELFEAGPAGAAY